MASLQFISSNKHKYQEMENKLRKYNYQINHFHYKYTELQADTIEEIAMASATSLSTIIQGDFFIEDSGLSIDALQGFPGPYSSYVLQTIGWNGILQLMNHYDLRKAKFISVIVLIRNNKLDVFSGECQGIISHQGLGDEGFGYDPIFIPLKNDSEAKTFAQLSIEEKNKISHRSKSVDKLIDFLIN